MASETAKRQDYTGSPIALSTNLDWPRSVPYPTRSCGGLKRGMNTIRPSFTEWFEGHRAELDAVVLDVDGILLVGHRPVPGSAEFLQRLRQLQFPVCLLTNDGNHSVAEKRRHLRHCGLDFHEKEITSCSDGLVEVARQRCLTGKLFFVMGDLGRPNFATRAGLRFTRNVARLPECAGVIAGEGHYNWETVINAVANFLIRHPARPLIVPNPDEYYPDKGGRIRIAAGGTARFIQRVVATFGTAIEPVYLGKPYRPIFEHNHAGLEQRLGRRIDKRRVVMVGDSTASDVRGSVDFGYRSALLLTGITNGHNLKQAPVQPELVFEGF